MPIDIPGFGKREEYAIEYLQDILEQYIYVTGLDISTFVSGKGHRKSLYQRQYQGMQEYAERLKAYANHIDICGESRNSYAKTDHDAKQYASDMECFVPLMEKFNQTYGHYPKYHVADAGYGSYNNYIY